MIASWKIVVIHAYNFSHLCMLVSYFSIDDFSSSVLFFFLFLETTRIFFFLPSSSPLFLSAFLYREFFPFRSRKRNAREWRGVRETNLPIYVSPLGEKEKGLAFEYLRAFQSVVWCYRSVGNGVPYQNGINREPENASRFLNRCLSSLLLMALRGNYYFPLVYIVWEFHRRSFAFVSRVGYRFEKFSRY